MFGRLLPLLALLLAFPALGQTPAAPPPAAVAPATAAPAPTAATTQADLSALLEVASEPIATSSS